MLTEWLKFQTKQIKWLVGEMTFVQHDLEHDNLNKDLAGMQTKINAEPVVPIKLHNLT